MSIEDPTPASDPSPRLRAETTLRTGVAVCVLIGDLDLHTCAIAESALDRALAERVGVMCVDMRDVHFCDSTGLNMLLAFRERCAGLGAVLALVAPSARVVRLLEVTDAGALFPTFRDDAAAAVVLGDRA